MLAGCMIRPQETGIAYFNGGGLYPRYERFPRFSRFYSVKRPVDAF
jgi:hypothetical protein